MITIKNENNMIRRCFSLLLLLGCGSLMAQTSYPGGVQSPLVWLKAQPVDDNQLNGDYHWVNIIESGDNVFDCKTGKKVANAARENINTYNFNPSIPFHTTNSLEVNVKRSGLRQATIIGVYGYKQPENAFNTMVYRVEGNNGVLLTRDYLFRVDGTESTSVKYEGFLSQSSKEEDIKRVKITTYQRALSPSFSLWDELSSKVDLGSVGNHAGDPSEYPLVDPEIGVTSYLSEFLVFGRSLSDKERVKVETYLAFKYGISLEADTKIDETNVRYMTSNEVDVTPKDNYLNRVFAYGRDDVSPFLQQYSTTSYEEKVYLCDDTYDQGNSLNKSSEYNLLVAGFSNKEDMNDGCLVVIGDNGKPTKPSELYPTKGTEEEQKDYNSIYHYMQREWYTITQETNREAPHTFELGYILTDDGLFGQYRNKVKNGEKEESQIFLVICPSEDGKFTKDNTDLIYYPMTSLDESRRKVVFENVTFPDVERFKFTFAYKGVPDLTFSLDNLTEEEKSVMKFTSNPASNANDMTKPGDGVKEIHNQSAISWYMYSDMKNSDKEFTIGVEMDEPETCSVYVYTMQGKLVSQTTIEPAKTHAGGDKYEKQIKVPSTGVYAVKLITQKTRNVFPGKILVK